MSERADDVVMRWGGKTLPQTVGIPLCLLPSCGLFARGFDTCFLFQVDARRMNVVQRINTIHLNVFYQYFRNER